MTDLPCETGLFDESASYAVPDTHRLDLALEITPGPCVAVALRATITGDRDVEIRRRLAEAKGLLAAVTEPGEHVVFNCSCGIPECAGVDTVQVRLDEDLVWWRWYRRGDRLRQREAIRAGDNAAAAEFGPRVAAFARDRIEQTVVEALDVRATAMRALRAEGLAVRTVPLQDD